METKRRKELNSMNRQVTYFTDEGDFGSAKGLVRINTTKWNAQDWTKIIMCKSDQRRIIAIQIETHYQQKEVTK